MDAFATATNNTPIVGNREDAMQVKVDYDAYTKWTYGKLGTDYVLGLVSKKIVLKEITVYQHYVNAANHDYYSYIYPNTTIISNNFDTPAPKALMNLGNPWTEYVTARVAGLYIDFWTRG